MTDRYVDVGYSTGEVGFGRKAAVLVVDWQLAFTDPRFALGGLPRLHAARDQTAGLLEVAQSKRHAIVESRCRAQRILLWP